VAVNEAPSEKSGVGPKGETKVVFFYPHATIHKDISSHDEKNRSSGMETLRSTDIQENFVSLLILTILRCTSHLIKPNWKQL